MPEETSPLHPAEDRDATLPADGAALPPTLAAPGRQSAADSSEFPSQDGLICRPASP